ncbi:MAG TPA: adenosylmethionine--8-amino-7-oxononanoate transaminase [Tepidisphaeraceae bacterium]|nr:adenosylmethionine--8-amino-7-oxononanoate transaminase [Tepidisphaeraceae bacterium]
MPSPADTARLRALDKAHVWHPFAPMSLWLESDPLVITAADGFHLIDSDGNRYLDGVSSLWCNVHGHRVPEIDAAIVGQLDKVAHSTLLGLANEPSILLAEQLVKIAPEGLAKVFYSDAGATATEIAFKLAVQYWFNVGRSERREFVAFREAYHGDTFGAISVGRMEAFHRPYLPMMFPVHCAPTPFGYRWAGDGVGEATPPGRVRDEALAALRTILERHAPRVAAICIEPIVQGAGGMIVQPPGFLAGVRALATEYDVLLICDEVATGFARTGKMFAVEHEGVTPDLMTVAKGLTGGYLPLAATLATQKIFDAFLGHPGEGRTFFHGHTYTGNPLACAAALANLKLMHDRDTVGHVARTAPILAEMLAPLNDLPHVGDVRQKGFMVGVELVKDRATRQRFDPALRIGHAVCNRLRGMGVILRPLGDVIVLMPPPAMGVDKLRTIVDAVRAEVATLP